MTELLNGDGSIPQSTSGYVRHGISSSTNASPIAVTFSAPHGFNEGDTIEIEGHAVNTAANGVWSVHITGASTLQLVGSTGNGVGAATGYAIDYSVNPLIQTVDDADAASASNFNTVAEGTLNFVPYLYRRVGRFRVFGSYVAQGGNTTPSLTQYSVTTPSATTWTDLTSMTGLLAFASSPGPVALAGDQFEITFVSSYNIGGTLGAGPVAIGLSTNVSGSYTLLPKSYVQVDQTTGSSGDPFTLHWGGSGTDFGVVHTYGDSFNIGLVGYSANATTNIALFGAWSLVVTQYRANT